MFPDSFTYPQESSLDRRPKVADIEGRQSKRWQ